MLGKEFEVEVFSQLESSEMYCKYLFSLLEIRELDVDLPVES